MDWTSSLASLITHPLIPLAMRMGLGRDVVSRRLLIAGMIASMVPDLDVIAFAFDIPYASQWGHRGFTHSFAFAGLLGLMAYLSRHSLQASGRMAFWLVFFSCASHAVLDAMTNGGLGSAFFWPVTDARYFMPWQPVQVSPIGISRFFSAWGIRVLASEMLTIWLPLLLMMTGIWLIRKTRTQSR